MVKKVNLNSDERLWLCTYVNKLINTLGDSFYTRHPEIGNVTEKIADAKEEWNQAEFIKLAPTLLRFVRKYLTDEELNSLFGYLQTQRDRKRRKVGTVWISDRAYSALRNWHRVNREESFSQNIRQLINNAFSLEGTGDADILEIKTPYEKLGDDRVSISLEADAREKLKQWKIKRGHSNMSQSIIDLVNIGRAIQQRKN